MSVSPINQLPADTLHRVRVRGANLAYIEQGSGDPVVCVHGVFADHRNWGPQRHAIALRGRFIAYSQRYFGPDAWPDGGKNYSQQTHVADLVAFIRQLDIGPAYVVGRSYGATIALIAAVQHPELIHALLVQEPQLDCIVTDPRDRQILREERSGLAAVRAAASAGDDAEATRLFFEWTNGETGGFDRLPADAKAAHLANGASIAPHFASPPGPRIACEELAQLQVPLIVTMGEFTRPYMRICAEAVHRCVPASELIVIPDARHAASVQNPAAFNAAIMRLLDQNPMPRRTTPHLAEQTPGR